jgi:hypothetical protein
MRALTLRRLTVFLFVFILLLMVTACAGLSTATPTPAIQPTGMAATVTPTALPSATLKPTQTPLPATAVPSATSTAAPTQTVPPAPTATNAPGWWHDLPVVPTLSERARQIYQAGLAKGNNPRAFAKAGDCETITDWFLVDFDRGPRFYGLGPYTDLQTTIDYFQGSFSRNSVAARRGFNAAALLTPFWADSTVCKPNETPLGCEFRLMRPSFVLIMVGTNDVAHKADFEHNLRQAIQFSLDQDVLPILATKADNLEGDESINDTIARLAQEYGLPLWNFWRAVQPLPDHGLVEDGAHLTHDTNFFDDPHNMLAAWPWRNLTALQVLDAVRKGVTR